MLPGPTSREYVWYAAYGSNMHADRLGYYLAGGTPPGAARTYPGCRDTRPPLRTAPAMMPGGIYFALESRAWTGGLALYDPNLTGHAAARRYLLTAAQFCDIAAQEMYQPTGIDLDLDEVLATGRQQIGPGRYETLVRAGTADGYAVLTFTAPWHADDVVWNAPAPRYLGMLASGLRESHGWSARQVAGYLAGLPGVRGNWTRDQIAVVSHATHER